MAPLKTMILFAALAGCVQPDGGEKPIFDHPEAHAHLNCIQQRGVEFSKLSGNPVDLAYVAAGQCETSRWALARAVMKSGRAALIFDEGMEERDVRMIAEIIYKSRSAG